VVEFQGKVTGIWFNFIEESPELGSVCLRLPTSEEYEEIRNLTVKPGKPDYHRGQRYETEKTNEILSRKLSLRKFIVDWKEVSLDGQVMDCTDENKEKMIKVQDFQLFIGVCIEKLVDGNKTIEEARVKNSGSSVNGDSA
ncbi:hypothetical protein LCGC14_1373790, partial [marine sediment metagenome]